MRSLTSVCLALVAVLVTAGNAMAQDPPRVYDFDDLAVVCGYWGSTTSGLYADLTFPSPVNMTVCNTTNGTRGLVPSAFSGGRVEVRVQLPAPASAVSVESFMYLSGDAPTLIAYDSTGVEIGRAEDGSPSVWVTLSVAAAADNPITEIGLYMPQLVNYLDNLTVDYNVASAEPEPEPLPEPDVEPQDEGEGGPTVTDPTSLADCQNGGWMAFGFRNQGQCVSFVRNGRDSR